MAVYLYNEILLSQKKDWILDTCNNMGESQINYAEGKKPDQKEKILMIPIYIKLYKNANRQWQKTDQCSWQGTRGKAQGNFLVDMFTILIMGMVSGVCVYIWICVFWTCIYIWIYMSKLTKLCTLNMYSSNVESFSQMSGDPWLNVHI